MAPDISPPSEEEKTIMIPTTSKTEIINENEGTRRDRKESLRDFLKNLGSVASLPGHQGKPFSTPRGVLNQFFVTFSIWMMSAGAGEPIGFSSILLPQLYVENSTMKIDAEMGSWIASLHSIATPIGSFSGGILSDSFGRLRTIQICILPIVVGWLVLAFSPNIIVLLIGRFLCGISVGIAAATSNVYLGEISDPKTRGLLSGTTFVSYAFGILIVFLMGNVPWRHVALTCIALPLISICFLLKMPESPDWLARHGKLTDAHKSVVWLRGDELLAKKEVHQIMTKSAKERDEQKETLWQAIKRPTVAKPIFMINVFNLLQVLSGTYMVIFYAVDIIKAVGVESIDNITAAIYTAIIRVFSTIVGCFMIHHMNRRTIISISSIGSGVFAMTLGGFLMSDIEFEDPSTKVWIKGACLIAYIAFNTVGIMMFVGVMVGELLPAKTRGLCGGYIFTVFNTLLFAFTKIFPLIKSSVDIHGLFFIFGGASFTITIFMYLMLPETRHKTFIQIERYFEGRNLFWITRHRSGQTEVA